MITEALTITPIRNDEDHRRALARVDGLMAAKPGTPEFDALDVLATLVDDYERRHHAMPPPTPAEAIAFRMESLGLASDALARIVGSPAKAEALLSGATSPDLPTIRRLRAEWGLPADVLIGAEAA